ncbi:potassium-transporting ATPase subunit KdpA [Anaerorhabdus sp.]|jgi:potassium-transporting ATPase potassium-binding subunit|uniref:potassium-transporting ATPase subunit KdpA n=1 Tax=Anaerorhabdus sp. TaxID=1872524 RepID=UPI002FCC744F
MFQIIVTLCIYLLLVIPVGTYLYKVTTRKHTYLDPVFDKVDKVIYRVCGINTEQEMGWKKYAFSLVLTNAVLLLVGYLVLRIQALPLFNPNAIVGMEQTLSFNTIVSFMTNTNLQHYAGESGLSYLSQMVVITSMMFTSAASGYAACMAFIRGLVGKDKTNMGNFYVDFTRIITRVLIPLSLIVSILLIWQGVPQTLGANVVASTIEGNMQNIQMGPVAALESIKHIGTNGGGFFGANSSVPFENPTVLTNLIELFSMMILPGACVIVFGKMIQERKGESKKSFFGSEGRTIFIAMGILFVISLFILYFSETSFNPALKDIGLSGLIGNMEGKEVRFGISQSVLFSATTTSFTTGTVNNMHDSLTPLGGMVTLLNMMLNLVFGGKGVGLMNMVIYVIMTVFICGLMIGRTPEYLGKKIGGKEMKLAAICIIIHPLLILAFSAIAVSTQAGVAGISNPGFHGLTQILYEFASSAANNGSGFEGLADNSPFWNITTGLVMFFGRYLSIVIQLAIAGSLMKKQFVQESVGTLKTDTMTFAIALVIIVYIFAALTFFPVISLGPVAEHLVLWG